VQLRRLWLTDFRCYRELELELGPGATVVRGANGQGKTSLLEAVSWIATARSFRGVPDAALVRSGAEQAVVRAQASRGDNDVLVEAEIRVAGRNRIFVNRQALPRRSELGRALRATVFAPDDLELVKGSPSGRRAYLDDLLVASAARYDAASTDFERILRHRNALLKTGGRDPETAMTLDVFDQQLAQAGGELVRGRLRLVARLVPWLQTAYDELAGEPTSVEARYEADWSEAPLDLDAVDDVEGRLLAALAARRRDELDRRLTLVGPHRDELRLVLGGLEARTHASQGEQRTLALALRLAGHRVVAEVIGENPLLLLDDVFSELDATRATALVAQLPPGQTLITTAGVVPETVEPERWLRVVDGAVEPDVGPVA
jgi:DNA replication and repair protein RecF